MSSRSLVVVFVSCLFFVACGADHAGSTGGVAAGDSDRLSFEQRNTANLLVDTWSACKKIGSTFLNGEERATSNRGWFKFIDDHTAEISYARYWGENCETEITQEELEKTGLDEGSSATYEYSLGEQSEADATFREIDLIKKEEVGKDDAYVNRWIYKVEGSTLTFGFNFDGQVRPTTPEEVKRTIVLKRQR